MPTRAVWLAYGLLIGVALALRAPAAAQATAPGVDPNGMCVGDANGDADVTVDELVVAVNNLLAGCDLMPVTLRFKAMVGDQPFACGNIYHGIGTSDQDIIPADFRMYAFGFRLLRTDGQEIPLQLAQDGIWQYRDLVMLDFEDKTPPCNQGNEPTNTTVRGLAPPGEYNGVRFILGVPFDLNHANAATAPSPLNLTSMFWSWQAGHKFFRMDEALDAVRVHVGSTGCMESAPNQVTACARPNRGEVYLSGFDPTTATIVADMAALFTDSDLLVNQPDTPPGCMSDQEDLDCDPIMENLGINFGNGLPDPSRQTLFRAE